MQGACYSLWNKLIVKLYHAEKCQKETWLKNKCTMSPLTGVDRNNEMIILTEL